MGWKIVRSPRPHLAPPFLTTLFGTRVGVATFAANSMRQSPEPHASCPGQATSTLVEMTAQWHTATVSEFYSPVQGVIANTRPSLHLHHLQPGRASGSDPIPRSTPQRAIMLALALRPPR